MLLFAVSIIGSNDKDSYVVTSWVKGNSESEARETVKLASLHYEQLRGRSLTIHLVEIPFEALADIDGKGIVDIGNVWEEGLDDSSLDPNDWPPLPT